MCASTEKGVRERNLWAPGKSQLSARRTPCAHSRDARSLPTPSLLFPPTAATTTPDDIPPFARAPPVRSSVNDQFKQFFSVAMHGDGRRRPRATTDLIIIIICDVRAQHFTAVVYNVYSFFSFTRGFAFICFYYNVSTADPFSRKTKMSSFFFRSNIHALYSS